MSRRTDRVRELMKRELGVILERDYEFPGRIVTILEVDLTPDLKQAFVYVSVLGAKGSGGEQDVIEKLNLNRGRIQRPLYKRVIMRSSPQLIFRLDDSTERAVHLLNLIEALPEPVEDEVPENEADTD
ncbi:MAG: 30S ribosome-binding factor RbfA [Verrucomicrobiales bacterium]|nr:30S ribosome-binding factor RbfA [Verrucomicrobiales bacterium]